MLGVNDNRTITVQAVPSKTIPSIDRKRLWECPFNGIVANVAELLRRDNELNRWKVFALPDELAAMASIPVKLLCDRSLWYVNI